MLEFLCFMASFSAFGAIPLGIGAGDLVQRSRSVGKIALFMMISALPSLGAVWALDWSGTQPERLQSLLLAFRVLYACSAATGIAAWSSILSLSISRGLRPEETPEEEPPQRRGAALGFGLLVILSAGCSLLCAGGMQRDSGLACALACASALAAFTRSGGARLEQGASAVISLVWVAFLSWIVFFFCSVGLAQRADLAIPYSWIAAPGLGVLSICLCATVAVRRRPNATLLCATLPLAASAGLVAFFSSTLQSS